MTFYTSIDELPIYAWRKINETNDLRFLLVKMRKNVPASLAKKLNEAWEKLYDEFIDSFPNEDLYKIFTLKRDIAVLKGQFALDNDRFHLNFIRAKEYELKEIYDKAKGSKQSFSESKAYISKFMEFQINERETSTLDYYTYLELLKSQSKK